MSLLQYFARVKVLPTTEETEVGVKATAEANKRVAEVLEHQQEQSSHKHKATVHSEEVRAKIGKYAAINGTASARRNLKKKELGDLPESSVRKYRTCSIIRPLE